MNDLISREDVKQLAKKIAEDPFLEEVLTCPNRIEATYKIPIFKKIVAPSWCRILLIEDKCSHYIVKVVAYYKDLEVPMEHLLKFGFIMPEFHKEMKEYYEEQER